MEMYKKSEDFSKNNNEQLLRINRAYYEAKSKEIGHNEGLREAGKICFLKVIK